MKVYKIIVSLFKPVCKSNVFESRKEGKVRIGHYARSSPCEKTKKEKKNTALFLSIEYKPCIDAMLWKGRQQELHDRERGTHQYNKADKQGWEGKIFETRQKRRASAGLAVVEDSPEEPNSKRKKE